MNPEELLDSQRLARYYGFEKRRSDGLPHPTAFCLRKIETYLSGNWIEYYGNVSVEEALQNIRSSPNSISAGANG